MGRPEEAAAHLRRGLGPLEISWEMRILESSVIGYLCKLVGEGRLARHELLLSIPEDRRNEYKKRIRTRRSDGAVYLDTYNFRGNRPEAGLFFKLTRDETMRSELYVLISSAEVALHSLVGSTLREYGGRGWWKNLVQANIRESCESRRAEGDAKADPFTFTDLIHLKKIICANWAIFAPTAPENWTSKSRLNDDFSKFNSLRNAVMHPVKGRKLTVADIELSVAFDKNATQWRTRTEWEFTRAWLKEMIEKDAADR